MRGLFFRVAASMRPESVGGRNPVDGDGIIGTVPLAIGSGRFDRENNAAQAAVRGANGASAHFRGIRIRRSVAVNFPQVVLISLRALGMTVRPAISDQTEEPGVQRAILKMAAALMLVGATTASAQNGAVVTATHGSWTIRCAADNSDQCAMTQTGQVDGQDALLVTVRKVSGLARDGVNLPAIMEVAAPLGILLTYQIRVKIDGGNQQGIVVQRCLQSGCVGTTPLTAESVNLFKRGNTANFGFATNQEIEVPVSLSGFTRAYDSLSPIPVRQ